MTAVFPLESNLKILQNWKNVKRFLNNYTFEFVAQKQQ